MSEIYNDNVQIDMTIGGDEWLVSEAEVQLSQVDTPNFVDINKMVPAEGVKVPSPVTSLVSKDFELHADNDLYSERASDASEDTLLFKGKLANISAIGTKSYEGIAYDPSQQPVAAPGEGSGFGGNGSVLNHKIYVRSPYYGVLFQWGLTSGTTYEPKTRKGSELAAKVAREIPGVDDYEIQLTKGGVTREGPNGSVTGAFDRELKFENVTTTIQNAVTKIKEECECDWWFDKEGKLYFGVPEPIAHELRFITDASDGITTPPYQSVKVIGSGVATEEGYSKKQLVAEDRITIKATFAEKKPGEYQAVFEEDAETDLPEPMFTYRNAEISTEAQARSTAKKIVEDLAKQAADGEITVTGFPEITPFDAVIMPHASEEKKEKGIPNYQEGMPMGGNRYGVYKVVHRLNGSDGFKTKVEVCGLSNVAGIAVPNIANEETEQDRGDTSEMSPREIARNYGPPGIGL